MHVKFHVKIARFCLDQLWISVVQAKLKLIFLRFPVSVVSENLA